MHPLKGIKVLDLTRLIPGAMCTLMLADMGAEIIKIEDPNGGDYARWMPPLKDDTSVFFRMNNRNKKSVVIDLKTDDGQTIFHKLVAAADVLVEGFRPGVMARLNSDYESLKAHNPRLVYCSLSGWGATGPHAQKSGHDLNYVTEAGMLSGMQNPQPLGGQVADIGGAYVGVAGILAGLFRREREGVGAFVDVSLSESALPFGLYGWVETLAVEHSENGTGSLTGGLACYRTYLTRDNKTVALAALEEKFWVTFCNAIERHDLIPMHQVAERQRYLISELNETFALQTSLQWEEQLSGVDCCFSVLPTPSEIDQNPQYRSRGMLGKFADGGVWMRSPIHLNQSYPAIKQNVPKYGEHTREILLGAGFSETQIEQWQTEGVIKV